MPVAYVRVYAELNELLPPGIRYSSFPHIVEDPCSVAQCLESCGVPRSLVDLVLLNGESAGFAAPIREGDRLSVYPVFESFDIAREQRLRPKPLRMPRFVLDVHLGKLAVHLRMLGFDAIYRNDFGDDELSGAAAAEGRVLLSKDRRLLARPEVLRGYAVREKEPRLQLAEVGHRFDLCSCISPFTRCFRCNVVLESVGKDEVLNSLPPKVRQSFDEFRRCPDCGRIYWKGSHYQRMVELIGDVLERVRIIRNIAGEG
jgi:uncharacterized protein with PIN domain